MPHRKSRPAFSEWLCRQRNAIEVPDRSRTNFLSQKCAPLAKAWLLAPANPKPGSEGSAIWIRGVGGDMTLNSNTSVGGTFVALQLFVRFGESGGSDPFN